MQELLPQGQEVIVGAVTDPTFGKVVAFGLGGVLVEVLKDVTFRLAPGGRRRGAVDAGLDPGGGDPARGARRRPAVDRWAVAEQIRRVSELVADFPEIAEVDLNPVIATPEGAVAADIRVILAERSRRSRAAVLARRDPHLDAPADAAVARSP